MIEVAQSGAAVVLVVSGLIVMLVGSIGIIRLPDFFARTHAAGMVDTVGIVLLLAGLVVFEGVTLNSAKLLLAIGLIAVTNPVAIHILARAALRLGMRPWRRGAETERGRNELAD